MTKMSDVAVPSLLITEATEPSAPAAGKQRLYIDSTTHLLKATNSSGTDRTIEGGSAPTGTLVEVDYVAFTSSVNITATTEATANTIVTANALSADGSTVYYIEFFCEAATPSATSGNDLSLILYDGSSSIGFLGYMKQPASATNEKPVFLSRRLTPSNASHTYSIRGSVNAGTGVITAGAGGAAANMPGYIRIVKRTA